MAVDEAKLNAFMGQFVNDFDAVMIVEPFANDSLEDNPTPVSQTFFFAAMFTCTPASRAREVELFLGARPARRATRTPFKLIFEARS